jgi:hypothetical protein
MTILITAALLHAKKHTNSTAENDTGLSSVCRNFPSQESMKICATT